MKFNTTHLTIGLALWLLSCSNKPEHIQESTKAEFVENVTKLQLGQIELRAMSNHLDCSGQIDVPPSDKASLFAPISGMINDLKVIPGTKVRKGELLATLEDLEIIRIQQAFLTSESNFKLVEQEYNRKKDLFDRDVISASEFQLSQSRYEIALADKQSTRAQITLLGLSPGAIERNGVVPKINLRSPISGYIGEVKINTSMYLAANTEILTIINPEHKHLEMEIFSKDIGRIKKGQEVHFKVPGSPKEYHAEVILLGQMVDKDNRSISVHGHLQQEYPELVVGTRIAATIFSNSDSVYVLPESALINSSGKRYALIKSDSEYTATEVRTGREADGYVEILNSEDFIGEQVIIENAYYFMEN